MPIGSLANQHQSKRMKQHPQMQQMLDRINQMRQDASEHKTAKRLWRKSDIRTAIVVAADSPELVRPIDAWRVYDFALSKGVVSEVKFVLRVLNPHAFRALCQYEGEEIESGVSAEAFAIAKATGGAA